MLIGETLIECRTGGDVGGPFHADRELLDGRRIDAAGWCPVVMDADGNGRGAGLFAAAVRRVSVPVAETAVARAEQRVVVIGDDEVERPEGFVRRSREIFVASSILTAPLAALAAFRWGPW
jgi:hypothetical protein